MNEPFARNRGVSSLCSFLLWFILELLTACCGCLALVIFISFTHEEQVLIVSSGKLSSSKLTSVR